MKSDYDDAVEDDNDVDGNAMLSALMEAFSRASKNTRTKPEWDGDQTTFKDFVFRFGSWCNRNRRSTPTCKPGHKPKPSDRERMFHELVGMLTLGGSGKSNRALDILKGYAKATSTRQAFDGFLAYQEIITVYDQRHDSELLRVEDQLRNAKQRDDEDVDAWRVRLEALNADAQEHGIELDEKRFRIGLVRGLRADFDEVRMILNNVGNNTLEDVMHRLRTAQSVLKDRGKLDDNGHVKKRASIYTTNFKQQQQQPGWQEEQICRCWGHQCDVICYKCGKPGHYRSCPGPDDDTNTDHGKGGGARKGSNNNNKSNNNKNNNNSGNSSSGAGRAASSASFAASEDDIDECRVKAAVIEGKGVRLKADGTLKIYTAKVDAGASSTAGSDRDNGASGRGQKPVPHSSIAAVRAARDGRFTLRGPCARDTETPADLLSHRSTTCSPSTSTAALSQVCLILSTPSTSTGQSRTALSQLGTTSMRLPRTAL